MKIAVTAGYWSAGPPAGTAALFVNADRIGIDQVWTAEAYGSDAWTPLAWWGSRTSRIRLGTAVSQLSARPPVTLAMTAMTMDHLTQGRILLGIGTSNPQVVEGWYGQPYPRPLERTREYIDIVRKVIARKEPVTYDGQHYQLPLKTGQLPLRTGTGLGKPLRSILHPYRPEIPIYLGAEGPKNVALAAEIADGWNAIFFAPTMNDFYAAALAEGFARPGARHGRDTFDVVGGPLAIIPDDDTERAADLVRPTLALYIGGMGARGVNFHYEVFARMGYEAQARTIQDHYLAGDKKAAIAAVPTRLVEDVALIGPWPKITEELERWKQTVLTTFSVNCDPRHLEKIADLLRLADASRADQQIWMFAGKRPVPGVLRRIVSLLLDVKESPEFSGELVVLAAQVAEVRIVGDPFPGALHLALGIADGELQAGDHAVDQVTQLIPAFGPDRERRVDTGQVVGGLPGPGAAPPGPAPGPGAQALVHRRCLPSRHPARRDPQGLGDS